ncbi:MAG: lasso peptide biosynthesis B2 protein [Proteobacteria bacterium]|nr:lasso peptide biosynthesis B2 protein [Pseudomonadota bacterium]
MRRFLALSGERRHLLVEAAFTLLCVRLALHLVPVERLRAWAGRLGAGLEPLPPVVWAVQAAARRVPGGSCLVSALALQRLLSRRGHVTELHVGVAKQGERFSAHAWLVGEGKILIGETDGETYSPLLAWRAGSPPPG